MADSKDYMTLSEENGSINIAEEVIAAIAVGAVREVEGVSGMMTNLGGSVTDLVNNKKNAQKGAREMFDAVCVECGKECQVPFKPTEGKAVYCSECFAKMKEEA
mgnify:CR=1 FL=1